MLAKVLKVEEIKTNMPPCFKHFQEVRIVIDRTEIPAQKAKSLKSRLRTYSHYKKGHTLNIYRDIFLTLNIVHTYSLCSILKITDQCIVSCYVTNYTEHQRF
jgi:hypothetical protein